MLWMPSWCVKAPTVNCFLRHPRHILLLHRFPFLNCSYNNMICKDQDWLADWVVDWLIWVSLSIDWFFDLLMYWWICSTIDQSVGRSVSRSVSRSAGPSIYWLIALLVEPTFGRQYGSLTTIQFVDFLYVLGAEFPLVHRPHLIGRVGFHQHSGPAVTAAERSVLVVHDGCQIVRQALYVRFFKCVLPESVLETYV